MSLILIASITICLAGMSLSIWLQFCMRDWRMGFLTVLLALMGTRQILTLLADKINPAIAISGYIKELPTLAVSILAFLSVIFLERILTQNKHANKKLKRQKALMHGILREMPVVALKIDEDGILIEAHGAGLARVGLKNHQGVGTNLLEEYPQFKDQVLKALAGESVHQESHGVSKNGPWWFDYFLTLDPARKKGAIGFAIDITERKLAEEAFQESETKYRALINALPDLLFQIRQDGTFLDFISARRMNSFPIPAKLVGKKICDVLPSEIAQKAMYYMEQTLQTGELNSFEYQLHKNSHTSEYEARLIANGKNEVLAIVRNISERKRVENALHESEERYRSLIENAPVCILEIDRNGNLLSMNSIGLKIMGIKDVNEIVGRAFLDLVAQKDRKQVRRLLNNAYKAQPSQFEFLAICQSSPKILSSNFIPLKGADGAIEKIISITQDITERKKTEEQLRKLYHAVEQSPSMVMITDPFGVIEHINPKYTEITGYSPEELLGTNVTELGDIFPEDYEKIWPVLNAGKEWRGEFYNKKKNGDFYWEFASISSIKNSEGVITHYIKVAEDLTIRKKLEEQLMQSQKMEAIGRLAGGLAHDFNNLLTAISGYSDFLLTELDRNDPKRQDIIEIQKAGERAAQLTRQLLAFSRKQVLQLEMLNVNEIIKDILNMLKRVIGENIELKINLKPNLEAIRADSGQLQQAILNLCINSRDAMPKGGQLTIETHNLTKKQLKEKSLPVETARKYVEISFIDTGVGMDQTTLKRLFEPFYTTKELGKGTGLGLAVVYGIVKQHNGHIEVESTMGKGTTFKIYMPAASNAKTNKKAKNKPNKPHSKSKTILVVEDDETVRNVVVRILKSLRYKILMAQNGLEAIKEFQSECDLIDLVIMDVVMPKCSGPEAYEKMRKIKPNIPVIFVTGYDVKAEIDELKLSPNKPVTVLQKPYTKESLTKKVQEFLNAS